MCPERCRHWGTCSNRPHLVCCLPTGLQPTAPTVTKRLADADGCAKEHHLRLQGSDATAHAPWPLGYMGAICVVACADGQGWQADYSRKWSSSVCLKVGGCQWSVEHCASRISHSSRDPHCRCTSHNGPWHGVELHKRGGSTFWANDRQGPAARHADDKPYNPPAFRAMNRQQAFQQQAMVLVQRSLFHSTHLRTPPCLGTPCAPVHAWRQPCSRRHKHYHCSRCICLFHLAGRAARYPQTCRLASPLPLHLS